jgi:Zn-dependent M32 family carboxypeptidase
MLAAQLFRAAQAEVPGLLDAIGAGDFARCWAGCASASTGRARGSGSRIWSRRPRAPLTPEPFLEHLRERYLGEVR